MSFPRFYGDVLNHRGYEKWIDHFIQQVNYKIKFAHIFLDTFLRYNKLCKMKITKNSKFTLEDVKHAAKLAKLELTPQEEKKLAPQLVDILNYVSQLQEVPTGDVEPTSQVTGLVNVFREDEIEISRTLTQEQALSNAPASHNGFVKVKAIFEE